MSYIEVTGKTEEEAVRKALTQLGLERDDVSLEILERAKSGFLGIGGSPKKSFHLSFSNQSVFLVSIVAGI